MHKSAEAKASGVSTYDSCVPWLNKLSELQMLNLGATNISFKGLCGLELKHLSKIVAPKSQILD